MDPNSNLAEQLLLAEQILNNDDALEDATRYFRSSEELLAAADRLAELVQALDKWLHNGGFLPGRWHGTAIPGDKG